MYRCGREEQDKISHHILLFFSAALRPVALLPVALRTENKVLVILVTKRRRQSRCGTRQHRRRHRRAVTVAHRWGTARPVAPGRSHEVGGGLQCHLVRAHRNQIRTID